MISSLRSLVKPHDYQLLDDGSSKWSLRMRALLVVCSHRVWRGGPRSMLQITAVTFLMLIFFCVMPLELGDSYQTILSWSITPEPAGLPGDLRIIVFGSQDVLGSAADANHTRSTWPEQLCKQLNCSSLLSFVPPVEWQPGLTSNSIYGNELKSLNDLNKQANITASPASDNFYIPDQYPVPTDTPDLETQVKKFLSMPPSKVATRETLWIFTFGTWDIWNLAALPRQTGEKLINDFITHMFTQVELLYRKSLNPKSIAFSDFWSQASKAEIQALTQPDPNKKVDERTLESFRVVIPQLFDITLTPGWQKRPLPSMPQSRGVQLRNAAYLTQHWNAQVSRQLEDWRRKESSKPEGIEEEGVDVAVEVPTMDSLLQYLPAALRPNKVQETKEPEATDIVYAPYPRRAGLQANLAISILDSMTEEEMQRSGLKDSRGRGSMPVNGAMRFLDVWTPCVAGSRAVVGVNVNQGGHECDVPSDHLFYDGFTFGGRAIEQLGKKSAELVREQLFAP